MPNRFRAWIEAHLPWYDVDEERKREVRTERMERRAEVARLRAARVIAEYRRAESKADAAAERVINEVPR